jgi:hypothetical protein
MNKVATSTQQRNNRSFNRFTKHIIIGAVLGGIVTAIPIGLLSVIPLIGCAFNCLFYILYLALTMLGIIYALWLYLKANQEDMLSFGEYSMFGIIAGAGAGFVSSMGIIAIKVTLGTLFGLVLAPESYIPEATTLGLNIGLFTGAVTAFLIPLKIILYSICGLVGVLIGMNFFFTSHKK